MRDFDKAIELNPTDPDFYYERGRIRKLLEDYDNALLDYNKVIELDPQADVYYSRGNLKKRMDDFDGALSDFDKAIELDPEFADAYNNRGYLKYQLQDYEGALLDYDKAIEIDPQDKVFYANRADLFEKLAANAPTAKEKKAYSFKAKADKKKSR